MFLTVTVSLLRKTCVFLTMENLASFLKVKTTCSLLRIIMFNSTGIIENQFLTLSGCFMITTVILNNAWFLSQGCLNLPVKTVLMWKRLLNQKQSWILSAAMILVRSKKSLKKLRYSHICLFLSQLPIFLVFIIINFFLYSCYCQTALSSPTHRRARIWNWGAGRVYPSGSSVALWHPASAPAVAPYQR